MTDYPSYVVEKFTHAAYVLATAPGDARSSVREAYLGPLLMVSPEHLPEDLAALWSAMVDRLTKYPGEYRDEGSIHASTRRMKNRTAAELAKVIYEIHCKLEERYP